MKQILILMTVLIFFIGKSYGQTIPKDKQLHIYAGTVVSGWGYIIPQSKNLWAQAAYGVGSSVVAGAGKELVDLGGFGTPDIKDFGATVIGGIVTVGVITAVRGILNINKHKRNNSSFRLVVNNYPINLN